MFGYFRFVREAGAASALWDPGRVLPKSISRTSDTMRRLILASLALVACRDTACVVNALCIQRVAIDLTVADSSNSAPLRATVAVPGAETSTVQCDGACQIFGMSGTYVLDVSATGFAPVHRTVQVHGTRTSTDCGCETTQLEHVTVAMVAAH